MVDAVVKEPEPGIPLSYRICMNEFTIEINSFFICLIKGEYVLHELPHFQEQSPLLDFHYVYMDGRFYIVFDDFMNRNIVKINIVDDKLVQEQVITIPSDGSILFTVVDTENVTGFVTGTHDLSLITFVDHEMVKMPLSEEFSAKLNRSFTEIAGGQYKVVHINTIVQWDIYAMAYADDMVSNFVKYNEEKSVRIIFDEFSKVYVEYHDLMRELKFSD